MNSLLIQAVLACIEEAMDCLWLIDSLVDGHIGIHDDRWLDIPMGSEWWQARQSVRQSLLVRADGTEEYMSQQSVKV